MDRDEVEAQYMWHFPSKTGRPAVNARQALGALIIQRRMGLSDRELVKEIARNPYYQFFIALESCPDVVSVQAWGSARAAPAVRAGIPH